ncbi:uncharacterized protein BKA55DRAFT_600064 [Fusarium redolens]|uniref:Uncharacterized protein n=1 Tax=Fusarium redolens TaxID=48865 RepID=A0A9P9FVH7_FUSRE|nr:uncharacterized protein BKA55DRAFT_600064 [Fusarium redolens]KAH7208455.1 hypothetical protein BKA55DRAFT_600064 [Fusarium redolens]
MTSFQALLVTKERREVYLFKIDSSGGAYDISYDAWNFLVTGKSALEAPSMGGAVLMTYEVVDPSYCVPLLQDGRLPLAAANSMNYLANCLQSPNSWVATHHVLYNIDILSGTSYELVFNAGQLAFSAIKRRLKEARLDLGYETIGVIEASPFLERQCIKISVILSYHWSSDESTSSIESPIIRHTESFEILANAAETILASLHNNQLITFSWDMGTCIPASVLGPEGIINKCQSNLRNLNLITDWQCYRSDPFWLTSGCEQRSELSLQGLKSLRRLSWKAPHEEDLFALSCVVDINKKHLEALELDFIEWDTSAGRSFRYGNGTPDVCPLLGDVLHLSPIAGGAIFPELRELGLSEAAIGPKLALAIDFSVLRVLKLRGCYGWCEFLEHLTASRVKLEITTFELIAAGDKSPEVGIRDDTIEEFLASFTGLQELYLLVSAPWFPGGQFSSAIANHRATLRQCVLDGLWENIPEEPERRVLAAPFGEEFLGILDLEAVGLINDPHTLVPRASVSAQFIDIMQATHKGIAAILCIFDNIQDKILIQEYLELNLLQLGPLSETELASSISQVIGAYRYLSGERSGLRIEETRVSLTGTVKLVMDLGYSFPSTHWPRPRGLALAARKASGVMLADTTENRSKRYGSV